jgi:hypothetical protein
VASDDEIFNASSPTSPLGDEDDANVSDSDTDLDSGAD